MECACVHRITRSGPDLTKIHKNYSRHRRKRKEKTREDEKLTECSAPKATKADTGKTMARYFSVREDAPVATHTVVHC